MALISLIVAIRTYSQNGKLYYYLSIVSFLCFLTFTCEGFEALNNQFLLESIFGQLTTIGYAYIPTYFLFLIYALINDEKDLDKKYKTLLLIIPTFFCIIALTNPWTGWFFSNMTTPPAGVWQLQLSYTANFGQILLLTYNIIIIFLVTINLLRVLLTNNKSNVNSIMVIFLSNLAAIIINLFYFTDIHPGFNWGAISYLITFTFLIVSIYLFSAFDLKGMITKYAIEEVDVGILYLDNDNKLRHINPTAKSLSLTDNDLNKPIETVCKNERIIDYYYNPEEEQIEILKNNKWYEINKTHPIDGNDKLGTVLTFTDITSQINELKEKDLLIKEVHHRIKNNFQIILSLLNLDLRLNSDDLMSVINDTRVRLNYMAKLHEKLYSSTNEGKVNVKDYLPDIVNGLFNMYNSSIKVESDLESYNMDLDLAVSLGLIVTEIINNTIKYAFPQESGKFYMKFKVKKDLGIFDFYDNGKGLPEGFNFKDSTGLGMTVIKSVSSQIDGEVEIIPDKGAHFRIKVPLKEE